MRDRLDAFTATAQRWWRILILFLVARLAAGLALLAYDGGIAWSMELTLLVAACVAVYVLVALAVRRWAPPRARPATRR
jgi:hypothetical protein